MGIGQWIAWIQQAPLRQQLVASLDQPSTVKQIATALGVTLRRAEWIVAALTRRGLLECLNDKARQSRVYWLTECGKRCQAELRSRLNLAPLAHDFPQVDWDLYGWVCFNHRSTIIRTLREPMQAATIKRQALVRNPKLRMSAGNVRDVMRLFLAKGIVQPVRIRKRKHLRYELTEVGRRLQALLMAP